MASVAEGIAWFRQQFGAQVTDGLKGTPYSLDLLTAMAVQETFSDGWGPFFTTMAPAEVLKICVGDSIDAPGRSAFPKNKADLLTAPNGDQIFAIAHAALASNPAYKAIAAAHPDKFAHGYGIFQYDIQSCRADPDFFLKQQWFDFGQCLARAVKELDAARVRAYGAGKTTLARDEMVYVAIAYNAGHVNIHGDFRQGFRDDDGKYYGEMIDAYMTMAAGTAVA